MILHISLIFIDFLEIPPNSLEKKRYISSMAPWDHLRAVCMRVAARKVVSLVAGAVLLLGECPGGVLELENQKWCSPARIITIMQ